MIPGNAIKKLKIKEACNNITIRFVTFFRLFLKKTVTPVLILKVKSSVA